MTREKDDKRKWITPKMAQRYDWSQGWHWALLLAVFVSFFGFEKTKSVTAPAKAVETRVQDSNWVAMEQNLSLLVDDYPGDVGIYIKDLNTGRVFEKNADHLFVTASLIKIPLMAAVFQAVQENKLSLNMPVRLDRKYRRGGSGHLQWMRPGKWFTVSSLLYEMITKSDNTAAAIFIDRLGYSPLNQTFAKFGLNITRIDPVGMKLVSHVDPMHENYTTPREMADLLEKIYQRKLVDPASCDLMMEIMKHAEGPTRLAQFLPKNWRLARKGGLLRKNLHDTGIVFTGKDDYVICVMTGNNASLKKAKGLIAKVGLTAYTFIERS